MLLIRGTLSLSVYVSICMCVGGMYVYIIVSVLVDHFIHYDMTDDD